MASASNSQKRVPRLVFQPFQGSKTSKNKSFGVRFRKGNSRNSPRLSSEFTDEENERSSMESTAGRGSYIPEQSDFTFKVVFLGDASVGKTCLVRFMVHRKVCVGNTQNTIGFDHHIKEVIVGGIPLTLNLWDTAGMEQFRNALVHQYYRNVNGIVFVYDITNEESFESIETWYTEAKQYSESNGERLKMVLIGNKKDREEERVVKEEVGRRYAESRGMLFIEVSAMDVKCLEKLDDMFLSLANQMLSEREENSFTRSMTSVIRLEGVNDDWEVVEVPAGSVPATVYQPQDESARMGLRDQFTSSIRNTVVRTNNRVTNSNCTC